MNTRVSSAARGAVLLAVASIGAASIFAAKPPTATFWPTSVNATFRCGIGDACETNDRLRSDADIYVGDVATTEGAFINANGGLSVHLLTNSSVPERYLFIDLSARQPGTDGPCGYTPSPFVSATEADLRVNVRGPDGTELGLDNLTVGIAYAGFGKLNYREPGQTDVVWTLRWDTGDVVVTRTSNTSWEVRSSSYGLALLECTVKKGRIRGGTEAIFELPFSAAVIKQ